jgi:hypothetical protein
MESEALVKVMHLLDPEDFFNGGAFWPVTTTSRTTFGTHQPGSLDEM